MVLSLLPKAFMMFVCALSGRFSMDVEGIQHTVEIPL